MSIIYQKSNSILIYNNDLRSNLFLIKNIFKYNYLRINNDYYDI